jgi:hypothetical protein
MPGKTPRTSKADQKKIPVHQLPEAYNKLLDEYVDLLQSEAQNPYELSIKRRVREYFSIKEQLKYVGSAHINDFMKTPDALAQELPAAQKILKQLDAFDDQVLRSFSKMNGLNLIRLRRRSIKNQIGPGIAFTGSIIGLLINFQDFLAVSIKDAFTVLSGLNISLLLQWLIILIIILAIVIARLNWAFITPRIGLVDAFGDILQIALSHRNLKE